MKIARSLVLLGAASALASLVSLAGCGSDDNPTTTVIRTVTGAPATTPPATTAEQPSPTTESTATAPSTTGPSRPVVSLSAFRSPTGNIGCVIGGGSVRCDIRERSWSPTPRPASCDVDWGQGISVARSGPADFVCAGDTALDVGAPVLPYGTDAAAEGFVCSSRTTGVTCRSETTGNGFLINRERYELF